MAYEINVSKNGKHYFATAERSIGLSKQKLKELYTTFQTTFPEEQGYEISVDDWERIGHEVNMDEILDRKKVVAYLESEQYELYDDDGKLVKSGLIDYDAVNQYCIKHNYYLIELLNLDDDD